MGRGPRGIQQSAAAVVDVALLHHHRFRARLSGALSGIGQVPGLLGWSSASAYAKERAEVDAKMSPVYQKYLAMDIKAVAADPQAHTMGERLFLNNCAQCHGSDAGGGKGFPNLRDRDWLYGGDPEAIKEKHHQRPQRHHAAARIGARRRRGQERRELRALIVRTSARQAARANSADRSSCRSVQRATVRTARATRSSARPISPTDLAVWRFRGDDRRDHQQGPRPGIGSDPNACAQGPARSGQDPVA